MSGKGSKQRPLSVPKKRFDENWDRIFDKKARDDFVRDLRDEGFSDEVIEAILENEYDD